MFFLLCLWTIGVEASLTYTAMNCSNLDRYVGYLQKAKKGTLEKHPKCNAAAIKRAYQNDTNKKKWIDSIEGPYQNYFGHPSGVFRDCTQCISKAPFYQLPSLEQRKKYVMILSVDGGGVKGLIAAKILKHLEERTGKKISDTFDIFVGTSTGGLISLFLNTPTSEGKAAYDATDLVRMYRDLSSVIFAHSSILRKLRGTKGVLTSKYSAKPYEQLLKKYFGNNSLKQTINPVLLTSVDIENQKSFIFNTAEALKGRQENFFLWEAARATSAAPTFFKPFKLRKKDGTITTLVDGGVGINNPALLGVALAKKLYPNAKILLVSFSTKVSQSKTKFGGSGAFGGGSLSSTNKGPNLGALVDNLLDVPSENAERTAKDLLEAEGSTYIRIEAEPRVRDILMDDGSRKALDALEEIADDMILNNKPLKHLRTILPSYISLKEKERGVVDPRRETIATRVDFFERRLSRPRRGL